MQHSLGDQIGMIDAGSHYTSRSGARHDRYFIKGYSVMTPPDG